MRIKLDGKDYILGFQYLLLKDPETKKQQRKTTCYIKTEDSAGNLVVVCTGQSLQHPHDHDVKFKARKYALRSALCRIPRPRRALIWEQYLEQTKILTY